MVLSGAILCFFIRALEDLAFKEISREGILGYACKKEIWGGKNLLDYLK